MDIPVKCVLGDRDDAVGVEPELMRYAAGPTLADPTEMVHVADITPKTTP